MYRTDEWIVQLTSAEIAELEAAAELLLTSNQNIASITAEYFPLPIVYIVILLNTEVFVRFLIPASDNYF